MPTSMLIVRDVLVEKPAARREEISDTETERVQENDGTDERGTSGENLVRGTSYYGRANQRHGENRDDRCEGFDALAEFTRKLFQRHAGEHRKQHDFTVLRKSPTPSTGIIVPARCCVSVGVITVAMNVLTVVNTTLSGTLACAR